jgi:hypothetical protein
VSGKKLSANSDAAGKSVEEFMKLISDENLTAEQIYDVDETRLFWRCLPRRTLAAGNEDKAVGVKESKERLTVLAFTNEAGMHKLKLTIIGKSACPRALKGVNNFPVHYHANKRAWITSELMLDWFVNYFAPEAHAHCKSKGLGDDCKKILTLDNCPVHPESSLLVSGNVCVVYLPPNCTSIIQPMDQGILRSLKCYYRQQLMQKLIVVCNRGQGADRFKKEFNIKDAIWNLAKAWTGVTAATLKNAWHNLWPARMFEEYDESPPDFLGFIVGDKKRLVSEIMEFAKGSTNNALTKGLEIEDIEKWMEIDNEAPVMNQLTDREIVEMVLELDHENCEASENDDHEADTNRPSIDHCIELITDTISALEQWSHIESQDILNLYRVKDKLVKERSKCMNQASLCDMFKTISQKNFQKPSSTEIYEPSVPATDDAASTSLSSCRHCK